MKPGLMNFALACCCLAMSALAGEARSTAGDPYANETPGQRDARMAWWREAKFGMFIHWGIYAVPAGNYHEQPIGGIGEWIMRNAKIPSAEYRGFAGQFTAANYDPKAWAALAKEAGMRYMVITSKHHDGFSLFPSAVSDWDAVDAAACKRDLIAPLAEAARAEGLKFGLYYSQSQDWMHPGGAIYGYKEGEVINADHKGSYDEYLKTIAAPQVREILTRYQPDVLWWDTPTHMTPERAQPLIELLKLKPGIIHNNRLGGGYKGDTETPEQFIPPTGFPGRDWETCMTMNNTWGFKRDDHDWKSVNVLIGNLVNIASKGGNYLLNIGPDATGKVPEESIQLLKQVGAWMKVNGESIYGTTAGPFSCRLPWGRCTVKADGDHSNLYVHVLEWPASGRILLKGLQNEVVSAQLLAGGAPVKVEADPHGPVLVLPAQAPDKVCSTIKLRLKGAPKVTEQPVMADEDGTIRLTPMDVKLHGDLALGQRAGKDVVTGWESPADTPTWQFEAAASGTYLMTVKTTALKAGAAMVVEGVGNKLACSIPKTENKRTFATTTIGEVKLEKGRRVTLKLDPVEDGWSAVELQVVELIPRH